MTPMIDVVFLLLIFFVCTASFHKLEEMLPTNLKMPETSGQPVEPLDVEQEELEPIIIKVLNQGDGVAWRVGTAFYDSLDGVRKALADLAPFKSELPVILDIDALVPMFEVVRIYDLCRLSGYRKVQFAARITASPP